MFQRLVAYLVTPACSVFGVQSRRRKAARSQPIRTNSAAVLASLILAACSASPRDIADFRAEGARSHQQYSAVERAAAAKLSLASNARLEDGNPYDQAVKCASSVHFLNQLMTDMGAMGVREKGTMLKAERALTTQVNSLASAQGKSSAQVRSELTRAYEAATDADPGTTATNAMACIKKLSESASPKSANRSVNQAR